MSVWSGKRIAEHIKQPPEIKINPNGIDMKVSEVFFIDENSEVIINKDVREIKPEKKLIKPDQNGFYNLVKGTYEVRVANMVAIPKGVVGFLFPRSTLNRFGMIKSQTAVWDSGYNGFGTQTIHVPIRLVRIHKDDFWFQIVFIDSEESDVIYNGRWQAESPSEKD